MSALALAKQYWLQADAEPVGLGLIVSDPRTAKQQLYSARRELLPQLPSLNSITIRTSPHNPAFELWLLKEDPPVPKPEETLDLSILKEK